MTSISVVHGVGAYLPEKVLSNDALSAFVDTSDAWIRQRTGIARRHIAAEGETTADMACVAAERAMAQAGVTAEDIDLIILATTTPDNTFPATATRVQARLGVTSGPAFDIQAVCTGFIYALTQADNMLRLGQASCALIIGAEIYSRILDWNDRGTCVLFGDGSGAMVLRAEQNARSDFKNSRGILSTTLGADGRYYDSLYVDGGPATTGTSGYVRMEGKEVFKQAVDRMSSLVAGLLSEQDLTVDDLDWLVPHQANVRIINKVGERLKLDPSKVIVSLEEHANTSAATIPLALSHAYEKGWFGKGDLIALTAMGGGFTWGASLLRW